MTGTKVGELILAARHAANISAKELATAVGVSPQCICDLERGRRLPTHLQTLRICNQFPDEDSAAWLWALLADTWGGPIASVMQRYIRLGCVAALDGGAP